MTPTVHETVTDEVGLPPLHQTLFYLAISRRKTTPADAFPLFFRQPITVVTTDKAYTTEEIVPTSYVTTYPVTLTETEDGTTVLVTASTTEVVYTSSPTVITVTPETTFTAYGPTTYQTTETTILSTNTQVVSETVYSDEDTIEYTEVVTYETPVMETTVVVSDVVSYASVEDAVPAPAPTEIPSGFTSSIVSPGKATDDAPVPEVTDDALIPFTGAAAINRPVAAAFAGAVALVAALA